MRRLLSTDDEAEIGDIKFDEQREERLIKHYDAIIGTGYFVQTTHGEGKVVGYELLHRNGTSVTTTKPPPTVAYRYMIKLSPGHIWMNDQPYYFAFDNEVTILLGQF